MRRPAAVPKGRPKQREMRRVEGRRRRDGRLIRLKTIDIATAKVKAVKVAISAAWRTQQASPMALRPDLAIGLPLSICSIGEK